MKFLIPFLSIIIIASCSNTTQDESTSYIVELKIKQVNFYGDTIRFDPPQILKVKPNSEDIAKIELGNGSDFGVKYYVSTMTTGATTQLMHNAAFFEKIDDSWSNMSATDHREKLTLNEELNWRIGTSSDGEQYFSVNFSYKVSEL